MHIRLVKSRFNESTSRDPMACDRTDIGGTHVAGRVMLRREMSKNLIFLTIQDNNDTIQIALAKQINPDVLTVKFGLWDIVQAEGVLAYTKSGEPTIWATSFSVLAPCNHLPPDKVDGVQDKEIRYRQRYLDLITNQESRRVFQDRSRIVSGIRHLLTSRYDFMEVETPVIESNPSGATATPFKTHHDALDMDVYLRIATEICLKKLVVGGFERVFEMGRIFRNEGLSTKHNPEFTSIELYAAYTDLRFMMRLAEEILRMCNPAWDKPFRVVKYADLMVGKPMTDEYFSEHVEPTLIEPTFVTEQPIGDSPLCSAMPNDPTKANRFELYVNGMEIANAYQELIDPVEQRVRLHGQPFVDEDFIRAMEYGMPPTAGMGIGIDRLVMLATGSKSIRDVILFPTMRPV